MLTLSQIILVIVVTILAILLVVFSIYIFRILDELRTTLRKTNSMLDDTKRITQAIADPIEQASEFVTGLKKGARLVELAGEIIDKRKTEKKTTTPSKKK